jgi:putative addiction module component (TIGR02574 family)
MSALDDAILSAEKLQPAERLQLIKQLWRSIPVEYWPPQSDVEQADVSRRLANLGVERTDSVPWPIVERLMADCARSSGNQVFAAPRRFDLSTIFVVTVGFALLFAGLRLLPFPPFVSVIVGGYFALIGLGQAFLFHGNRPRTASMLVGMLYYAVGALIIWQLSGPRAYPLSDIVVTGIFVMIFGAVLGFAAGALVGSVFMIADFVRHSMRSGLRRRQPELAGES